MSTEVFILVIAIHIKPTIVFFDEFSYFNENYNEILHRFDFFETHCTSGRGWVNCNVIFSFSILLLILLYFEANFQFKLL